MQRLRTIVKWTAASLGVLVALLLVLNAWYVARTDARLEKRWAQLRAEGHPVSLADLAPAPIPPEKNAATYLRRAEADLKAIDEEVCKLWDLMGKHPLPTAEEQKAIREVLEAHPDVLPLLEQAAAAPGYDAGLDYSVSQNEFIVHLLPVVQAQRSVARALYARAALLTAEGKRDEAVETSILLLRLARHFDRCPVLVSHLVSVAIQGMALDATNRTLQAGPVAAETRKTLDAELALDEPMKGFRRVLTGEHAFMRETIGQNLGRRFWLGARGYWNRQELAWLDALDDLLTIEPGVTSYADAHGVFHQAREQVTGQFAQQFLPTLEATYNAVIRPQATIRCLRVLNAIQLHAGAGEADMPELSDLGLPAATTTDPFNGQPLRVNRLPDGWLVYSVGNNEIDDGGKVDDPLGDVGVGPIKPPASSEPQPVSAAATGL